MKNKRHFTEDHKRKLREARRKGKFAPFKGKHHSKEFMEKLRNGNKGNKYRLGKYHSEKTRTKMSETRKRLYRDNIIVPIMPSRTGEKHSLKTRIQMSAARKGEKCHLWKGGITPLYMQVRKCFQYRQWRSDVFTRDNFTCVLCGKKHINLEIDHYPKSFINIFRENKVETFTDALSCQEFWNINNGRTLCSDCHYKAKKYTQ